MDIKVIIEHSTDGMYYCTPEDNKVLKTGLIGCGKTVEEAKEDFFTCYEEAQEMYRVYMQNLHSKINLASAQSTFVFSLKTII